MVVRLTSARGIGREEAPGPGRPPRNLAGVTQSSGSASPPPRRGLDRLFGAAAEPSAPRPERDRADVPTALRWAAAVVGIQAAAIAVGAAAWLWLTLTSTPDSLGRAIAEVVILALVAAGLGAAAVGLARAAPWARGPVVAAQIFLGLCGYVAAFEAERPLIGLPMLLLVATELYLLATPGSRLAYLEDQDRR